MLISAFNAYLIKYCENIVYRRILFILARLIKYNIAPVHHNKARALLHGIAKIMRYHNSRRFFLLNHFIGKLIIISAVLGSSAAVCSSRIRKSIGVSVAIISETA